MLSDSEPSDGMPSESEDDFDGERGEQEVVDLSDGEYRAPGEYVPAVNKKPVNSVKKPGDPLSASKPTDAKRLYYGNQWTNKKPDAKKLYYEKLAAKKGGVAAVPKPVFAVAKPMFDFAFQDFDQGGVQQSRLSSQFSFQCYDLQQLLKTQKNVPFHLNLHSNLQF